MKSLSSLEGSNKILFENSPRCTRTQFRVAPESGRRGCTFSALFINSLTVAADRAVWTLERWAEHVASRPYLLSDVYSCHSRLFMSHPNTTLSDLCGRLMNSNRAPRQQQPFCAELQQIKCSSIAADSVLKQPFKNVLIEVKLQTTIGWTDDLYFFKGKPWERQGGARRISFPFNCHPFGLKSIREQQHPKRKKNVEAALDRLVNLVNHSFCCGRRNPGSCTGVILFPCLLWGFPHCHQRSSKQIGACALREMSTLQFALFAAFAHLDT